MNKRPISITVLGGLYLIVGTAGLVFHFREILERHAFQYEDALIELVEVIAIVCGVFLLRGRNWARWLAVAWMALHVAISFLDSAQKVVVHGLFLAAFAYLLFRADARAYFRHSESGS